MCPLGHDNSEEGVKRCEDTYERDVCNERDDGAQTWRYGGFPCNHHEPEDHLYDMGVSSSAFKTKTTDIVLCKRQRQRYCEQSGVIGESWYDSEGTMRDR